MKKLRKIYHRLQEQWFLFTELSKRDFKLKYKGTVLGMLWSVLSPLLQLLVMRLVFTQFFGRNTPFYTTYLFTGVIVFNFFVESTTGSMGALQSNKSIITKIKVPKYLFILSRNVSSIINFLIIIVVYFLFVALDGVTFGWHFLMLIYPVVLLIAFCIGTGMVLSAMQVFFRDTKYLYGIFTHLLRYVSAVFYRIDSYPQDVQRIFLANPVYAFIKYFRVIVMDGNIPSFQYHMLLLLYSVVAIGIGGLVYRKNSQKFNYYL